MQKLLILFILFYSSLHAFTLSIASYNVENLFDLNHDHSEYKEYIPFSNSQWNQQNYQIKLHNTAKVLHDMQADIIALQEIESNQALEDLSKLLPQYPYKVFSKNPNSAVGLAVISKYPIINTKKIVFKTKVNRPIQKVSFLIQNTPLVLFNNHWASKRHKESERVNFALQLQEAVKPLSNLTDYLLIGDFNSNYNENESLKFNKRINDTNGYTGINHVLNTLIDYQIISKENILEYSKKVHYNPWYELQIQERFSSFFRKEKQTPDHIILSKALFDNHNFSYVNNSFKTFKPDYLYNQNQIKRWNISKDKIHQQSGFSDHLPIMLKLELHSYHNKPQVKPEQKIKTLYSIIQNNVNLTLKNVTVLYKYNNHAIIKDDSNRSIFLYDCASKLQEGHQYNLTIKQLKNFQGLHEVTKIEDIQYKGKNINIKKLFIPTNHINLHDIQYQNEIIRNLDGIYKNGYLYYQNNKKIRLYSKDKSLLPKNGQNITIINAHLGYFKNQAQLIIYKQSDFSVN